MVNKGGNKMKTRYYICGLTYDEFDVITDFEHDKGLYYECAAMSQKVLNCMEKMRTTNGTE
jgi:hypothetical protein